MKELFIGIAGAIFGAVFSGFITSFLEKRKEKKKRILTNEIIVALSPQKNYRKAEELLGLPDRISEDYSEIDGNNFEDKKFESSLYYLHNAYLKITTIDKQSIHAISVLSYDSKLVLPFFHENINFNPLGRTKINQELIDNPHIRVIHTFNIRESAIILSQPIGAPFYTTMNYFCNGAPDEKIEDLLDREIFGFCLSNDQDDVFYIHDAELRW